MNYQEILSTLKEEMPYHWRVQSFSKKKPIAVCVPYIDARQVMERLDSVGVPWQDDYMSVGDKVYCKIGLYIDGVWHWRSDVGSESNIEADKGQASDAFKRAGVKWGIGRFLYNKVPVVILDSSEAKTQTNYPYVVDGSGRQVFDLTKHINKMHERLSPGEESVSVDELHSQYMQDWTHYESLVGSNRASGSHPENWKARDANAYENAMKWIKSEIEKIERLKNGNH